MTFLEMRQEVTNYCKLPNTTGTKADNLAAAKIKNAIRKMNKRPWKFLMSKEDITLIANTRDYALTASDIKKPRSCQLLRVGDKPNRRYLRYMDSKSFVDLEDTTIQQGTPRVYTFFNINDDKTLTLDTVPGAGFLGIYPKMRLRYYRTVQFPSADADKLTIPSDAEMFILWQAKFEMALDEAPEKAMIAHREAKQAWEDLIDDEGDDRDGWEGNETFDFHDGGGFFQ
jgi:hypothetical protein